ncbi:MAG: GntR family transcriptional regulator [Sphingomonas sp.]
MSDPDTISERVYLRLKEDVASGYLSVHVRLDFAELASRYDVSTTPVREAAMRLLGEDLLDLHPKGGLRPAPVGETDLVALIDLHERLTALALRWSRGADIDLPPEGAAGAPERARQFFAALARATGNAEFVRVMARIDDRLDRYRRLEAQLLPDAADEVAAIERAAALPALLGRLLRRYHRRRRSIASRVILLALSADEAAAE